MGRKQRAILILALVLLTALAAAFLVQRQLLGHAGGKAVVQVGGQGKQELNLSKDQEFWVGDPEIGRNLVRVEDGTVMEPRRTVPIRSASIPVLSARRGRSSPASRTG